MPHIFNHSPNNEIQVCISQDQVWVHVTENPNKSVINTRYFISLFCGGKKKKQRQPIQGRQVDSMVFRCHAPFFSSMNLVHSFFFQGCLMSPANISCFRQLEGKTKNKMAYLPAKPALLMQPSKSFIPYFQFYLTDQNLVTWPCLAAKDAEEKICDAISNKI